ncbi:hypothetical protein DYB38_002726 [Aphanomyces astaci]|uniref:Alpha/beta hydrolase fold-3 domain-containing protein n=2 Tax=Aphanomyces astaci TaxID=112090 RepID=A0A397AVI1_APHAT|nr:hypothetical protein DYB36_000678 [Aphanomyces astaci]RHY59643.1 hypothetical protein DYB34_001946 [Aphanomyces astaci]RHY63053.1 hypothetical protein DYB38_002726 [Aphanomyces astaci]
MPANEESSSMSKSKSTVLLMGQIVQTNTTLHNAAGTSVTSGHGDDVELLVQTSTAILSTIQVLRRIIKDHTYSRVGRELRHLSLTVGCFERVLFSFIKDEIIRDPQIDYRHKQALKDIIPLIPTVRRHTILAGGVASLLRQVIVSMTDTKQVLLSLSQNYDPFWENRWSFTPFTLLALAAFVTHKRFASRLSFRAIFSLFRPSVKQIQYSIFVLVCYDYLWRFSYRFSKLRQIKVHHARVSLTLRLFLLCEHVLDRTRLARSASRRLLIDSPVEADINDDLKSATSLLVERVPLPAEYYDASHEPVGMKMFKAGGHVMCASSATAQWLLGARWYPTVGPYLLAALLPYYAIRHRKAAALATRVCMDNPDIVVIRMAWNLFGESWLAVKVAELRSPSLPVRTEIFVDEGGAAAGSYRRQPTDIGVRIFSCRPVASVKQGSWEHASVPCSAKMDAIGLPTSAPVLFYIHGGGFFGRFWAKDIVNLSAWAVHLGAVIVYVDYTRTPEAQYPVPLNQCFTVYKWVLQGGLGFHPSSVAMFGESAGGNLAAAVCLKSIQERIALPDGLVLVHPALTCNFSPSPSRFLHQSDPVLPRGILELALNSYYPFNGDQYKNNTYDPLVAVGLADDALLRQFPPTALLVGDMDPLLDDSVDFYTRLNNLQVESSLKVLTGLTHGFLIYPDLVPAAQAAIDDIAEEVHAIFKRRLPA